MRMKSIVSFLFPSTAIYPFAKRHKRAKAKGFVALYYHYCYLLKVFPTVPQQKLPISLRADIARKGGPTFPADSISGYLVGEVWEYVNSNF